MVQKRPFVGDSYVISSKHPKFKDSEHLVSFLEFPSKIVTWKPNTSGNIYDGSTNQLRACDVATETCTITTKKCTENSSGGNSNSSLASNCTIEEDLRLEGPYCLSVPSDYDDLDYPSRTLTHSQDTYARLLKLLPQKLVPIGSDFQAELPQWCPQTSRTKFSDDIDTDKFSGLCVTPMPAILSVACDDDQIRYGKILCGCVDPGSITCARRHVVEAREDLSQMVGKETFTGLGLHEMGEVVAEKWSDEDEQAFEEVVISNPSSRGNNFWKCLSEVFPYHTSMEIVSYYYNVYILRKRAQQNRSNSMYIDSDDDEWQESEDEYVNCEDGTDSEDSDSVVESPACQGIPGWNRTNVVSHVHGTGIFKDASYQYNTDVTSFDGISDVSNKWNLNYYETDPMFSLSQRALLDVWGDSSLNDQLCTSYGTGTELQSTKLKTSHNESFAATSHGASAKGGHEYFLESCDTKVWDFGYETCRSNDIDFFPTCNVIEEVFRAEDLDNKATDDRLM